MKVFLSRMFTKLLLFALLVVAKGSEKCQPKKYDQDSVVCVCNADHCDTVGPLVRPANGQYLVYTSDRAGSRLEKVSKPFFNGSQGSKSLKLNRTERYQEIIGFGGAFTDSTGININSLDEENRENLLKSYFSEDGIEYNIGRVPIGGTDFSTHGYSYMDDDEGTVKNFSVQNFTLAKEDFDYKIPLMKEAERLLGRKLKLFGSAWIAPKAWKSNNQYQGIGFLRKEHFQDWADYYMRFLDLYKKEGFDFWGITTGNEPTNYLFITGKVPTVPFFSNEQVDWINNNLGPTLRKSKFSKAKLIALDDQTPLIILLGANLANNVTNQFVDGVAVHWYVDNFLTPSAVSTFHQFYPDKFIFNSEACVGEVVFGKWEHGEKYADSIITDLLNYMGGWVDWNMALNVEGGPTYIDNFVNSPIIVNASAKEFYKQPMYYAMGHFSKFLPEKSVRIGLEKRQDLEIVAFERPDNGTAIIVLNKNDKATTLNIVDEAHGEIVQEISPKSFNSIVYW